MVANVYLNEFDQEMMKRGHRIVRYANDILIFTRSKSAAENALCQARVILEDDLKLTVNQEKTHLTHSSSETKFLGVIIFSSYTKVQPKKINGFKEKVKNRKYL